MIDNTPPFSLQVLEFWVSTLTICYNNSQTGVRNVRYPYAKIGRRPEV